MQPKRILVWLALAMMLLSFSAVVYADSVYNETTKGDLSGDRAAPSKLDLTAGLNRLSASSVRGDLEYVHIVVPPGHQLEHAILSSYVSSDTKAFIAIQAGAVFTEPTTGANPAHLLGYTHFGPGSNNVGSDILDDMGAGAGSQGFTGTLPSGNYTLWIQQAGTSTTTYSLDFLVGPTVSAVLYNEATDGDISGDRQKPITRTLISGGNVISATSVRGDLEYMRLTVPLGHQLNAALLTSYVSTDTKAFIGVQRGATFTEPPNGAKASNILGYLHFGPGSEPVGSDMLDNMSKSAGAIGFKTPLGSGDYTFWSQQAGTATTSYAFNLIVSAVATKTVYAEATNGDLSGDATKPTTMTVASGGNVVAGSSIRDDREYFTLDVPVGHQLEAIFVQKYESTDQKAFIAVQRGATFTEPPTGTKVANLLGYSHFGPAVEPTGSNILDNMGAGQGAQGFSGSLPSGSYTFWTQQTGGNASAYELNFVISEIPIAARVYLPVVSNKK